MSSFLFILQLNTSVIMQGWPFWSGELDAVRSLGAVQPTPDASLCMSGFALFAQLNFSLVAITPHGAGEYRVNSMFAVNVRIAISTFKRVLEIQF